MKEISPKESAEKNQGALLVHQKTSKNPCACSDQKNVLCQERY